MQPVELKAWFRRELPMHLRDLLGRGMRQNQRGLVEPAFAKGSPVLVRQSNEVDLNLAENSGLAVEVGSPPGLAFAADEVSLFREEGRVAARPPTGYVRNESRVPGKTLDQALDLVDSRYRGTEWAGSAFPVSVWDGRMFYRTDQGEVFFYSGARALWMSVRTLTYLGSSSAAIPASGYFTVPGGEPFSATIGYPARFNMTLTEVAACKDDVTNDPAFEVRADGVSVYSLQIGAGNRVGTGAVAGVNVTAGQVLSFYLNGALLLGGHVEATFRRTLT